MKGRNYKVVSIYDTETTNIKVGGKWHAFPVTFQVNTILGKLKCYEPGKSDNLEVFRTAEEMIDYIERIICMGQEGGFIPVLCGYNLMFDLQPIMSMLVERHPMDVCAQSTSNVYYIDIMDGCNRPILRMWDTYHLEMNGLSAMGEVAGLYKLKGDWDYTLVRAPQTRITDEEMGYALRDVQVIPAYLRYLLEANHWLTEDMLGHRVLTKTSLVRRMAEKEVGPLKVPTQSGKCTTLTAMFRAACKADLPSNYYDYALRKACFRGGFTFTASKWASVVVRNAASLDVTSMHHTFINGRYVPENFTPCDKKTLQSICENIVNTPVEYVLSHYHKPFREAVNVRIAFNDIKLREGSPFAEEGIALAPRSKFGFNYRSNTEYQKSQAAQEADRASRMNGWKDRAVEAEFAFGKLYSAKRVVMHLTEIELYAMSRVYEWSSMEAILGECTLKWSKPPMYVVIQSHLLFKRKQDMKVICKYYKPGVPYERDIPSTIPEGIANALRKGELSTEFVESYYQSTVKGMFNAIFGTQAQDMFKPSYMMNSGLIVVDHDSVASPENFELPKSPKVYYSYGCRIVGGSRLHLVLATEMLYNALPGLVHVTGGDTDSLKMTCDPSVTDDDLIAALEPIAIASKEAIDKASSRARELFPDMTSDLAHVGAFEVEDCGDSTRWAYHMEAWNKARISCDEEFHTHITCAGLPRPENTYTYERLAHDLMVNSDPYEVLPMILGYNVFAYPSVSHGLQRTRPSLSAHFDGEVTDYLGGTYEVSAPESIALYPCGRWLGQTDAPSNAENVAFLKRHYNREVDTRTRYVGVTDLVYNDGKLISGTPFVKYEEG